MAEHIIAALEPRFAIGRDALQVIIYAARRRPKEGDGCAPPTSVHWKARYFVPVSASALKRRLRELDCRPTPEAQALLDGLPDDLRTWTWSEPVARREAA